MNLILTNGRLFPGTIEVLKKLKNQNHELVVCSNGKNKYINRILDHFKIQEIFTLISGSDDGKSKSQRVKKIYEKFNLPAVMIGDKKADIDAAKNILIPSVGALYGLCHENELNDATFLIKDIAMLNSIVNWINIYYKTEEKIVRKLPMKRGICGISGVDTAGKTIFTKQFYKFLKCKGHNCKVVHLDDFHNPKEIRSQLNDPVESYLKYAFDLNKVLDEILIPIKKGNDVSKELKLLCLETDKYEINKNIKLTPNDLILLEGVLLFREPLNNYFDYRIYIDINYDYMVERAHKRGEGSITELEKSYHNKRIPIQKKYILENSPKKQSDIIINNNDFNNPTLV